MPSEARRVILRLVGFTGWPLLTLITPLIATPTAARLVGPGWSTIVTAMSIGVFGSTVVTWGWNYVGPARVARMRTEAEHNELYTASVASRLVMCVIVAPVCAVASAVIAMPSLRATAAVMAVAFVLTAMSPQWYCIGVGNPRLLGYYDTLPRAVSTVIAIPVMLLTHEAIAYPIMLGAGMVAGLVLFRRRVFPGPRPPFPGLRSTWADIRGMGGAAGANLVGAAYAYTPSPVATATLTPVVSSQFASADQIYRYALFFVQALGNALQGWVLELQGAPARRRQRLAIMAHTALGLVGALGLAVLTPTISSILYGAQVGATYPVSAGFGLAFFAISTTTPLLRNLLIPTGQAHKVFRATVIAAVGGLAVMVLGGVAHSATVIAVGMACSELLILLVLAPSAVRTLGRMGAPGPARPADGEDARDAEDASPGTEPRS
ncbi:lipopolysaccharide biosynthesis protein [Actinomyces howellii]|uniref:Polysaccharide biosynthesis protein n=1 Tax=Actinomyces howellii TaxID=52771 RepID=A0A448HJM6_9ACTO|nr:polysaccharide biosynthesis protein [Actinomyces howellii]VEG29907.1 Uncharacterised protein [Actinomyces howellii]